MSVIHVPLHTLTLGSQLLSLLTNISGSEGVARVTRSVLPNQVELKQSSSRAPMCMWLRNVYVAAAGTAVVVKCLLWRNAVAQCFDQKSFY
mmetsp:Transcript_55488/g.110218  ORF Transcript_55488/g.110218 Transcript_55488/m.110218 type:complete len:91 (-) Transcript_55488:1031-1303(-)